MQANLHRYRAAVLKAACEGRLVPTEHALKVGRAGPARRGGLGQAALPYETGEQLLQRILKHRREKWAGKGKYKEPAALDTANPSPLPEGWATASLDSLLASASNGFGKRGQEHGRSFIVLRLADIKAGKISLKSVRRIDATPDEIETYQLKRDDLLVIRVNGSPDLVGRLVHFKASDEPILYCDHFIRIRLLQPVMSRYVRYFGETPAVRRFIELNKVSSAGQNTVSQSTLGRLCVPLPPLAEQERIVAEVEGRLSVVEELSALVTANLQRAIRRELLKQAEVHTLLRLPTGIFYAQGVKANVLFFERKPAQEKPWTEKLWIYDLRTNKHFTLKENTLQRTDLDDFVACYNPKNRHVRKETDRFRSFTYEDLLKRDKVNLDIFWLKDESLEDSANLPPPADIAEEIVEDLQAALEQFSEVMEDLGKD